MWAGRLRPFRGAAALGLRRFFTALARALAGADARVGRVSHPPWWVFYPQLPIFFVLRSRWTRVPPSRHRVEHPARRVKHPPDPGTRIDDPRPNFNRTLSAARFTFHCNFFTLPAFIAQP